MPIPRPASRMSSRVFSAWTLAACSPRSTGMEPTDSKKAFMTLPLTPPVVKYSALAKKATGRGISAWTITLSKKERWLGATIKGPSDGTFSSPTTVGRQVPPIRLRVVQRTASNISIVAHPAHGRCVDSLQLLNDRHQLIPRADDGHGSGFLQFAVRGESPDNADAVKPVGDGSGHVLGAVAHHDGVLGIEVSQGSGDDLGLSQRNAFHGCLVISRAMDAVEKAVDAVVRQHFACQPLGLLGCHRDGPACLSKGLEDTADARVQPALGNTFGDVVLAVEPDHLFKVFRRDVGHVKQGVAQLGADHRIEQVLAGNREPQPAEG